MGNQFESGEPGKGMSLVASNPSLLVNLADLLEKGYLTQAEFHDEKAKLLSSAASLSTPATGHSSSDAIKELASVLKAALVPQDAASPGVAAPALDPVSCSGRKRAAVFVSSDGKRQKTQPSMFAFVSKIAKRSDGTTRVVHEDTGALQLQENKCPDCDSL